MHQARQVGSRRPGGYSLIEVLVVISIIAALIAISVPMIGSILDSGRRAATLATIEKADSLLQDQIKAFNRKIVESPNPTLVKQEFQRAFPQTAAEATGSSAHAQWLKPTNMGGNKPDPQADSSELLYLTLTRGRFSGAGTGDAIDFSGSELADTDSDTFPELVDGWGNPLRFYRWPTRLLHPFGFVAGALDSGISASATSIPLDSMSTFGDFGNVMSNLRDPAQNGSNTANLFVVVGREIIEVDAVSGNGLQAVQRGALNTDPEPHAAGSVVKLAAFPQIVSLAFGSLTSAAVIRDPDDPRGSLLGNVAPIQYENDLHTLDSYHTPLIVSAGSDEELGLLEPILDGTGDYDRGNLAQPDIPVLSGSTRDFTVIVNPGNTPLADNLTNLTGGLGN